MHLPAAADKLGETGIAVSFHEAYLQNQVQLAVRSKMHYNLLQTTNPYFVLCTWYMLHGTCGTWYKKRPSREIAFLEE